MHDEATPSRPARRVYAKDLNDVTARIVRLMLNENDLKALRDTGSGTPDEAELMLRCYELATLPFWDKQALADAATVAGDAHLFTLAGGGRERIERRIDSAFNAGAVPAALNPAEGVALLYQLRLSVWDELEEAVSHFKSRGWYDEDNTDDASQTDAPVKASSAQAAPKGVPKAEIIGALTPPKGYTLETWEKTLGDAKRIAWLKPARVDSGARGVSALWNPAQLAMCICDRFGATPMQRRSYGRIIEQHFPDWLPEWKEYVESFEVNYRESLP